MKLPPNAGRLVATQAVIALVLVAVGIAAVLGARHLLDKARTEQQAAARERESAQSKLARATDEEREIRERLVDYQRLLDRGLIGEERRLDWVDRIGEIRTARKLIELKYSIEPQRPADYPGIAGPGDVEVLASPMKLEMALLHEEDLFRFISDLKSALSSHVFVRSCSISRSERVGEAITVPRLRAECTIDLVTIRDRKVKG